MSHLLRGLALAFLVLGAVCAANAVATGEHAWEAAVCFALEFAFLWLSKRRDASTTALTTSEPWQGLSTSVAAARGQTDGLRGR